MSNKENRYLGRLVPKQTGDEQEIYYWDGIKEKPLPERRDLAAISHGLTWGYLGSGPMQLSVALLAHHLGDDQEAMLLYYRFYESVICRLPQEEPWELTHAQIDSMIIDIRDNLEIGTTTKGEDITLIIPDSEAFSNARRQNPIASEDENLRLAQADTLMRVTRAKDMLELASMAESGLARQLVGIHNRKMRTAAGSSDR